MASGAPNPPTSKSPGPEQKRRAGYDAAELPVPAVVRQLLRWFTQHARLLPWRRRHDPYAVWVAEVMLQQTQAQTVVPYWRRWMRTLPTLRALARATPQQVLKLWEGLGYYRRARYLHRTARLLVARHGGRFPRQFDRLLALPGIGRYTAGAICSIAFNQPTPVLDGNVTRVLIRLLALSADPARAGTRGRLWQWAAALVAQAASEPAHYSSARTRGCAGNCSLLNQALMELGATVCTARTPRCGACPLRRWCRAFHTGQALALPRPRHRAPTQARHVLAFVINAQGRLLLRQRPAQAIDGGLWEFPNLEVNAPHTSPHLTLRSCLAGARGTLIPLGRVQHTISNSRIDLHAYALRLNSRSCIRLPSARWVTAWQLARLPLPAAHRQVLSLWMAIP
jgi:A/G-specific adenine glycosylase